MAYNFIPTGLAAARTAWQTYRANQARKKAFDATMKNANKSFKGGNPQYSQATNQAFRNFNNPYRNHIQNHWGKYAVGAGTLPLLSMDFGGDSGYASTPLKDDFRFYEDPGANNGTYVNNGTGVDNGTGVGTTGDGVLNSDKITNGNQDGVLSNNSHLLGDGITLDPISSSSKLDPSHYFTHPGERPTAPYTTGLRMLAGSFQGQPGGLGYMGGMAAGAASGLEARHASEAQGYSDDMSNYQTGMQAYRDALVDAKEADAEIAGEVAQFDANLADFQKAYAALEENNLTGVGGTTMGFLNKYLGVDNPFDDTTAGRKEAQRMLLKKLRVDDALLRIAQTKGAISNKEMDLFLDPAPSMINDEETWQVWIKEKYATIAEIRNRIANGTHVKDLGMVPATLEQANKFSSYMSGNNSGSSASSNNYDDVDQIVGLK